MRFVSTFLALLTATVLCSQSDAQIDVFLDFNADWITELNQATADAGVADFNASERGMIQDMILGQVQDVYTGYLVNFTTTAPGGTFDTVNFGFDEGGTDEGVLGFAPLQIGNFGTGDTLNMVPRNFSFFIDEMPSRAEQIQQISRGFSGTLAHELGHSLGLNHQNSYGNAGISPANYANTGGLQNLSIMATGDTGLDEIGRESARSFNRYERAMLDITGGTSLGGQSVVMNPIVEVGEGGDAGDNFSSASAVAFAVGETSGMQLALRGGDLDNVASDEDFYSFTVNSAGSFVAELFSVNLEGVLPGFDGELNLYDTDGTTLLASNNDVFFDGNAYGSGIDAHSFDPFLLNIDIAGPGTYFLSVSAVGDNQVGDEYKLLLGFASAVPEPSSAMVLLAFGAMVLRRRR